MDQLGKTVCAKLVWVVMVKNAQLQYTAAVQYLKGADSTARNSTSKV